ncbi:MAG: type II toxin-antitoxin system RelE/ParE family toxin [Evtepia sp.]|nr:type II toxin-antitoxin system RelE/ParE family toxin [Evtepia sp.]
MSKIVLTAQAKKDLEEIKVYISHHLQNPTSAKNTIVGITKELRRLERFPQLGPVVDREEMYLPEERFLVCGQYLAFYRIDKGLVTVDRILYGRRNYAALLFDLDEEP